MMILVLFIRAQLQRCMVMFRLTDDGGTGWMRENCATGAASDSAVVDPIVIKPEEIITDDKHRIHRF